MKCFTQIAGRFASLLLVAGLPPGAVTPTRDFELPQYAFEDIMRAANKTIHAEFQKSEPDRMELRAQALLIALAAQNRMPGNHAERARLATLRDAAVTLARSLPADGSVGQVNVARTQAQLLGQFPKIKANPNAVMEMLRLKGVFNQEDIDLHFSNWNGGRRIEKELNLVVRQKTPITAEQLAEKIEPLAYRVALLGEILRDFDDHIPSKRVAQRKEWVAFATEVQYTGWELAGVARANNSAAARPAIVRLSDACINCHTKFRD